MNLKNVLDKTPGYLEIKLYVCSRKYSRFKIKSCELQDFKKYYDDEVICIDLENNCLRVDIYENGGNKND